MKSVTGKIETLRRAEARSVVRARPETLARLAANDLPKKDVLAVARVAGISAAKKTSELIPYCHPVPIDFIAVDFETGPDSVSVTAVVEAVAKTGLEMEALTAASVAALTIYDMLKPVDDGLEITATRLVSKKGGKSDYREVLPRGFRASVLVTSDGTFQGKRQDKSGKIIVEKLESFGIRPDYAVLPDDKEKIRERLAEWCGRGDDLIVTTGGTGLGPRDVTVEATREIMDREIPGIAESARAYGQRRTPYAMLSRGVAAQKGRTIILNLPGSSNGVRESLAAVFPAVLHTYQMMEGGGH
ncbi:MAG: bifunctional molybdenum cofactor biosynthesis protein MoaC/MoaB [Candidatus Omnitrophica bacterium]|nr:bifunctional molybdenum cofactor biosynthesis protein MoaC/MoaB [Candidatus Omnitrophota bacterium]